MGPLGSTFGQLIVSTTYDPRRRSGLGQAAQQLGVLGQHHPGADAWVSADVAYFHRTQGNYTATDNRDVGPADYDPVLHHRADRQPAADGGGNQICGLYDLNPASSAPQFADDNFMTFVDEFGEADGDLRRLRRHGQCAAAAGPDDQRRLRDRNGATYDAIGTSTTYTTSSTARRGVFCRCRIRDGRRNTKRPVRTRCRGKTSARRRVPEPAGAGDSRQLDHPRTTRRALGRAFRGGTHAHGVQLIEPGTMYSAAGASWICGWEDVPSAWRPPSAGDGGHLQHVQLERASGRKLASGRDAAGLEHELQLGRPQRLGGAGSAAEHSAGAVCEVRGTIQVLRTQR